MVNVKRTELLFYIGWFFFSISVILELTDFSINSGEISLLLKLLRYVGYAFCCLKLLTEIEKKWRVVLAVLLMGLVFISSITSTNKTMMLYSLVLLASDHVNAKNIMKMSLMIQGGILGIIVGLSQTGILRDYLFVRGEGHYRHGLGFSWTTTAPILFFFFTLIFVYLKREKCSILQITLFEIINVWFYKKTDSRMVCLLASVFLCFVLMQIFNKNKWRIISKYKKIYISSPMIICCFSLLLFVAYNEKTIFWTRLNTILSGRLQLGTNAIAEFGVSLFGNNIEWIGFNSKMPTAVEAIGYNYVDSSYLQLGLNYGVVFLIMVLLIYVVVMKRAVKIEDYWLICVISVILIFSITEPRLMNLAFNPFPLLAFCELEEN